MTTNFVTTAELQQLARLAAALKSVDAYADISIGEVTVVDTNGELLATYRYVDDIEAYTFVFDGQLPLGD